MKYKRRTNEELQQIALKYNSRGEFYKEDGSAYNISRNRDILDDICQHMKPLLKFRTNEELTKSALKYNSRGEFRKNDYEAYRTAIRRNILDEICQHMKYLRKYLTNKELEQIALKYNYRSEFQEKDSAAYQTAHRKGILDEICQHMKNLIIHRTNEELRQIALKYNYRSEFEKKDINAYAVALRRGIINEICQHMQLSINISSQEQSLFDLIKEKFPKTQKLRDMRVKIDEKPYIKGFDIDIYIPELRKGIEFDGTYWHTMEGLKRGRPDWPKEDLKNYHKIKDNWFKSKDIKILHIKEKDWLKDINGCLKKCFEFLER